MITPSLRIIIRNTTRHPHFQVAGKLEIRVVPKEPAPPPKEDPPRPQTLSPQHPEGNGVQRTKEEAAQAGDNDTKDEGVQAKGEEDAPRAKDSPPSQPRRKVERTKSILKQGSKERQENQGESAPPLPSPKREQITFAPEAIELEERREADVEEGEEENGPAVKVEVEEVKEVEKEVEKEEVNAEDEVVTSDKQTGEWFRIFL